MEAKVQSPFKFLNAFQKEDKDLYFGRDEEVAHLYDLTYDTRLIVFFGASGTGKTSMIQCGLANKFSETRWQELYIRRDGNINESILKQLSESLDAYQADIQLSDPIEGIRQLHKYTAKPLFITFDQFEEIFILQPDEEEQKRFFRFLQELVETPLACKVILVMREEFIAHLWDFEYLVPGIFDNRFRIKSLEEVQMREIIESTFSALEQQGKLQVEDQEAVSEAIMKKLLASKAGTGLTYLQVFLDRIYKKESREQRIENREGFVPLIRKESVEAMGSIEDVIDDFLDEQLLALEAELGSKHKGTPLKILGAMVSNERTKKVLQEDQIELLRIKYHLTETEMNSLLQAFENMRILNRYES